MGKQYTRIFAALDGAKTQEAVAERALKLASEEHASLCFGHVVDSVPYEAAGTDFAALSSRMQEQLEQSIGDILAAAKADPNIPDVQVIVKAGRITETLAEQIIAPYDPDLVICGERGLSNIKYVFVGSVSTYLIRNLRCDVLVVKQD
ncbi:universal stress protein [Slackia heliotrinireducens]|uniref:universal stress protein n=1 Tax=Slackia heliotrinireducens TaxID=84110 RepID=UPI0033152CC5